MSNMFPLPDWQLKAEVPLRKDGSAEEFLTSLQPPGWTQPTHVTFMVNGSFSGVHR